MDGQTDQSSHDDDAASIRELYHQLVTPKQARDIDRLLDELSKHDENSYPYINAVLTTLQLRTMARMPKATAEAINSSLSIFDARIEALLNTLKTQSNLVQQNPSRRLPHKKSKMAFILDWPLNQQYDDRLEATMRDFIACVEEVFAYRARWVLLCFFIFISVIFIGFHHQLHTLVQEQSKQNVQQFDAWKRQVDEETKQLRAKTTANAEMWATQQVSLRLDKLLPESYLLAQELERSSRSVILQNGMRGWEVRLGKMNGLIDTRMDYKDHRSDPDTILYFQETPGRLMLSATKPAPTPIPEPNQSKPKHP